MNSPEIVAETIPASPAVSTERHDLYRQLVDGMVDPIAVVSGEGKIVYLNQRAEHLLHGEMLARVAAHLARNAPRLAGGQVRFERPGKRDLVLRIKFVSVDWMGEKAALASLRNVTHYVEAIRDLQRQLAAHAGVVQDVNAGFQQLQARTVEEAARLTQVEKALQEAREQVALNAAEFQAAQMQWQMESAEWQARLADLMQNHRAQGQELVEQSAERHDLKRQVQALQQENAELRKTAEETRATQEEAERTIIKGVRLQHLNARLESEVTRLRGLLPPDPAPGDAPPTPAEALQFRSDCRRAIEELQRVQARDAELRETLTKVRKSAFNAKQDLEKARQELDALNQQIVRHRDELTQAQSLVAEERAQRRRLEEENRQLVLSRAELQARLESPRGISGFLSNLRKPPRSPDT